MSNWLNNLGGFNPIQRTTMPNNSGAPANNAPASNAPAFGGSQGVDSFTRSNELIPQSGGAAHEIVNNVSKLSMKDAGNQLHPSTFEALRNPNFEFPPIQG